MSGPYSSSRSLFLALVGALAPACGNGGGGDADAGSSTGTTTGTGTTDTTGGTTSEGTTSAAESSSSSTGALDESSGSSSTGGATDCDALPPGPLAAAPVFENPPFSGSEDIAFDGQGNLAGKRGTQMIQIDAGGAPQMLAMDLPDTYGVRYLATGELLAAAFGQGQILAITGGQATPWVTGVGGVNGLFPDFDGRVWFTNFGSVGRVETDMTITPIVQGPDGMGSNGIWYDADRGFAYYTNYTMGFVRRVPIDESGDPGTPEFVAEIPGTSPDGLAMDACGNLYVVDQGNSALWRVFLDEGGAAVGEPEPLVEQFDANVANAVFGSGDGWDPETLYVAGNPGVVFAVDVGVGGAPVVVVE